MRADHKLLACSSLLLRNMPSDETEAILSQARVTEFDRGQTVFIQGEAAKAVYIVMNGWVKLYRIAPSGTEAVVGVFTKGRSFGEAVAFSNDVYPVSAEAVTNCTLMRIEAEQGTVEAGVELDVIEIDPAFLG